MVRVLVTVPSVDGTLRRGILPGITKVGDWCKISSSSLQSSVVKTTV